GADKRSISPYITVGSVFARLRVGGDVVAYHGSHADRRREPMTSPRRNPLGSLAARFCRLAVAAAFVLAASATGAAESSRTALVLTLDGAVGPATADYIARGIRRAERDGAAAVVLRMDTPGGLDTSMREIIRAIVSSPVPVLSFV